MKTDKPARFDRVDRRCAGRYSRHWGPRSGGRWRRARLRAERQPRARC